MTKSYIDRAQEVLKLKGQKREVPADGYAALCLAAEKALETLSLANRDFARQNNAAAGDCCALSALALAGALQLCGEGDISIEAVPIGEAAAVEEASTATKH